MTRIASPSRKNVWSFLAFGVVLGLGAPALLLWASRAPQADKESSIEKVLAQQDAHRRGRRPAPAGNPRPVEVSPFGDRLASPRLKNGDTNGFILTPLGHLDPAHPDDLLRQIPPRLLYRPGEVTPIAGRGALAEGLNYLMLRKEAIAERPLEDVTERIQ